MDPSQQHKEIAKHIADLGGADASVHQYRDNAGRNPVLVAAAGPKEHRLYSTVGVSDRQLSLPAARAELALIGSYPWLPNALASTLYWLRDRSFTDWPVVCEDVVKHNTKGPYHHLAFCLADAQLVTEGGRSVNWLVGIPIRDSDILVTADDCLSQARKAFPHWFFPKRAKL